MQKKKGNEKWVASRSARVKVLMISVILSNCFTVEAPMKMG